MLFKSNFFRAGAALCLVLTMIVVTFADTIRLKDGSIIKGKIVSFGDGKFVVQVGSRQLNFSANEVESITFDREAIPTPNVKTSNNTSTQSNNDAAAAVEQTTRTQTTAPKVDDDTTVKIVKPIEINVKVSADNTANGWTNSGWVARKGQRIKISGAGRVSLGDGRYATPGGIASLSDKDKLMQKESTGGLIAVVGDNNNDFIFIGDSREFVATQDGALFLGVNEGNLNDNSGVFDVKIEISPDN